MKKILVMVCALAMVMAVAGVASADGAWLVNFRAYNSAGSGSAGPQSSFGELSTWSDGNVSMQDGTGVMASTQAFLYCVDLDSTKMWNKDKRASLVADPAKTVSKTWNLVLNIGTGFTDTKALVKTWISTATNDVFVPADANETLKLYDAAGNVVYTYAGTGSEATPNYSFLVDASAGSTYNFTLVHEIAAVTTPEPGSIVALLSGLAGLGGLVIRRKK